MVRRTSFLLTLLASGIFSIYAGSIRGIVEDNAAQPNPIPGAIVTVMGMIGGAQDQLSDTTDQTGAYQFLNLDNGTYFIRVAKTGYTPDPDNPSTVRLNNGNPNAVVDLVLIPRPAGVTISGTVTDSLTNANLAGVKLLLQQRTMMAWTTIDSTASSAAGAYSFDSVAAGAYRIQASLSGYAPKTVTVTVAGTQAQTVNIKLVAVQAGKLTGKIADSATGAAIDGATVILERIATPTTIPIDTVTADAGGVYLFASVEAGITYNITASKAGYISRSVRHRQTAGTDTVNIALTKPASGSIYVLAMKQKDSVLIAGATATVVRTTGGASVTLTTDQTGIAAFVDLATGTYNITVSATDFIPAVRTNYRLVANAKDTLRFYLTAATGGTKTLVGTVTESISKAPVPNARVALQVTSLGGSLTLIDSTDASGNYAIRGIPVLVYLGSITATCSGFRNYSNAQVTLGQPGQADTARLNFAMVKILSDIVPGTAAKIVPGAPGIAVSGTCVALRGFTENGVFSLYSPNGRLVYRTDFPEYTTFLALPSEAVRASGIYILTISQKTAVYRRQVMLR